MLAALSFLAAGLASMAPQQAAQPDVARIRVFLFTRSYIAQVDPNGAVRQRFAAIDEDLMQAVLGSDGSDGGPKVEGSLDKVKKAAEQAGKKIQFEVVTDQDPIVHTVKGLQPQPNTFQVDLDLGGELTWEQKLLKEAVAPYINSESSDREKAEMLGPYQAIVVLNAAPLELHPRWTVSGTPLLMLPWTNAASPGGQDDIAAKVGEFLNQTLSLGLAAPSPSANSLLPRTTGAVTVQTKQEAGATMQELGSALGQSGSATLWERGSGPAPKAMRFSFRTEGTRTWSVDLLNSRGDILSSIYTGYVPAFPVDVETRFPVYTLNTKPSKNWQEVLIDFSKIERSDEIAAVRFSVDGPFAQLMGTTGFAAPFTLRGLEILPTLPSGAVSPLSAPPAEQFDWPGSQTGNAALASLNKILDEGSTEARLTALYKLQTVKVAGSEEAILGRLRGALFLEAALAAPALRNQEAVAAQQGLVTTLVRGPFDFNRMFASEQLVSTPNSAILPAASAMMLSTTWRPRVAAARLTALTKAPEAGLLTSAMLNDPNPCVRAQIVQVADISEDTAARRVLFAAVNDASLWVRALAYARMLECPIPDVFQESLRGVRDNSPFVKRYLLARMAILAKPEFRESVPWAVVDENSAVRAQALRTLAALPADVKLEEIEPALTDTTEEVQLALIHVAVTKNVTLPAEVVDRLKSSPHQSVKQAARRLGSTR